MESENKTYEVLDESFLKLVNPEAKVTKLWGGDGSFTEGPVYFSEDDSLLFSDITNNKVCRYDNKTKTCTAWRDPSNMENGHTRDLEGRLLSCVHLERCLTRTEKDGTITTLVDKFEGKRLNSPNDVVVKSDGTIWFTDPNYGISNNVCGKIAQSEIGAEYVFRFDPKTNDLSVVATDFYRPNGLAFSPDEKILYIVDSSFTDDPKGFHHIRSFDVVDGKTLANSRIFADITPGIPDGLRVTEEGYVITSAGDGVQVLTPEGKLIGKIYVPEVVANLTFGGPNKDILYITATTSLYSIQVNVRGVQKP